MIFLIYSYIDKFIWKLITSILAVIIIPAGSWFVMNSLRKAREMAKNAEREARITGQDVAIVSNLAGTTTDPVKKSVEIFGVGPVIIIDTAGVDKRKQQRSKYGTKKPKDKK